MIRLIRAIFVVLIISARLARVGLALALLVMGLASTTPVHAGWNTLSGVLPAYVEINDVVISPNSQYVVFTADIDVDDRRELYSVPISGSVPIKLNPPLVAGGDVVYVAITPDSSRVIYTADQEVDARIELYSVPIGGGAAVKLNGPLVSGGNVSFFKIDAGSGRVVYVADQQSNDVFELYSVPIGGGAAVKLNPTLAPGGDLYIFDIDPVSGRVVYSADQDTNDLYELYSVPIAGGSAIKLNPPVSKSVFSFAITPGVAYVMFIAQETGASAYQLYGNDTPGGVPRKRNYILSPGENVIGFRISPTAMQVVYTVGANNLGGSGNLWRASPYAGGSQLLSEVADPSYGVGSYDFVFTPDGERVVYAYQKNPTAPRKLQSVRANGSPLNRVDLFVPDAGRNVGVSRISPDSQWVVFEDYGLSTSDTVLRAVAAAGGNPVTFGIGSQPVISPDNQRVIYIYRPSSRDRSDLLSIQIFGGGQRNLSRLQSSDFATSAQISPNGQWVVFQTQLNGGTGYELRVSDGAEAPPVFKVFLPLLQK